MKTATREFMKQLKEEFNGCPLFEGREKTDIENYVGKVLTLNEAFEMSDGEGGHYYAYTICEDDKVVLLSGGAVTKLLDMCKDGEFEPTGIKFEVCEMTKTKKNRDYRPIRIVD